MRGLAQLPGLVAGALIGSPVERPALRGQVVAGAERPARALQPNHPHRVARIQLAQRRLQVIAQRAGDCVQLLRTIQRDRRHRPVNVNQHVLVFGHQDALSASVCLRGGLLQSHRELRGAEAERSRLGAVQLRRFAERGRPHNTSPTRASPPSTAVRRRPSRGRSAGERAGAASPPCPPSATNQR